MKQKRITTLFLTDLHVGSWWGLWNPNFQIKNKSRMNIEPKINGVQLKLWEYWHDLCNRLSHIKPDVIFLIGDIIEGLGRSSLRRRTQSLSEDLNDQLSCALSILRMVPKKTSTQVLGLVDTSCGGQHLRLYKKLFEELGGDLHGTTGVFTFAGHNFRVYHGSTTAYIYLETVVGRRRTFAQEAVAGRKIPEIDGIICGHSHRWLHMRTMWRDGKDFHVVLCPGWEGQTDFMALREPDKLIPEIGAVVGHFERASVDFDCIRYPTPLGIGKTVRI